MNVDSKTGSLLPSLIAAAPVGGISDPPFTPHDDDSIERITTLGAQEPNPYLIPNMQKAYLDLGYNPNMATVTNLYVRFKPSVAQVSSLDSTMDAQGLDLFDTPMDYDVTYEGDYYQDPSIPDSLPTWQYAVVPPTFSFPSGITHETLAQIHIPSDAYTAVETEAENIAGGGSTAAASNGTNTVHPNVPQCPDGQHWDFNQGKCVSCPGGYSWNGTACVPVTCQNGYYYNGTSCVPYNTTPPAPAADAQVPAGNITVQDTQIPAVPASPSYGSNVPVQKARMVARRWFKIERTYTDNNGHYQFSKHFKHKVRILLKFKNDDAQVRNVRDVKFWQMLFAVKYELGIYSSDKNNANHIFSKYPVYSAKGNMFWTAATVHNSVQEYRSYASLEGIGLPPQGLKIFISKSGLFGSGGSTPMFAKRVINNIATAFVTSYISPFVADVVAVVKSQLDMVIGYQYILNGNLDINQLLSDRIKETTYHELTHAAHYSALGNSWYTSLVNAEEYENEFGLSAYKPYGDGVNTTYSPIIALGESWAEYIGQYLADKKYGQNSSEDYFGYGGGDYTNNHPINGFSSHLNDLENFDPNVTGAKFSWIPVGLYYDMNDNGEPQNTHVVDQVSGYTNQQFFNAFSSSITSLSAYKTNFINQVGANPTTTTNINNLFTSYEF